MKTFSYTVTSEHGIHGRPASMLVKTASAFHDSTITLSKGDKSVDAKRIFSVLSLAAQPHDTITISVTGGDEEAVAQELKTFLEENL